MSIKIVEWLSDVVITHTESPEQLLHGLLAKVGGDDDVSFCIEATDQNELLIITELRAGKRQLITWLIWPENDRISYAIFRSLAVEYFQSCQQVHS